MPVSAAPSPEEVRSTLEQILASNRFVRSGRASQLLGYLVEATLSGRGESIKAFSIAVDVFGKDQSFDADNDTLVRVQAGRETSRQSGALPAGAIVALAQRG